MSTALAPIQIAQAQILRYIPLTLLLAGTIGNILNCLIFSRRSLRSNSCSVYFLWSSVANFLPIYFGCLTRLISSFGGDPPASQMGVYCKVKTFLTYVGLAASTWFIVGACADRFASSNSNARIRAFSQVKIARRVIAGTSVIVCLVFAQMIYCFNGTVQSANCVLASVLCNRFNDLNLLVSYSLFPPILMLIFGLMTIRNVRAGEHVRRGSTSKDRQLTVMLLVQVACVAFFSLPISIQKIYAEYTINQVKGTEQVMIESFFATFVVLLVLVNSSTSFYMFTLTGRAFRKELKSILFCSNRRQADVEPTVTRMRMTTKINPTKNEGQ